MQLLESTNFVHNTLSPVRQRRSNAAAAEQFSTPPTKKKSEEKTLEMLQQTPKPKFSKRKVMCETRHAGLNSNNNGKVLFNATCPLDESDSESPDEDAFTCQEISDLNRGFIQKMI